MSRPTKLTPTLIDAIVADVRRGTHVETVAALHGISKNTFHRWLRDGARERDRLEEGRPHPKGTLRPERDRLRLCAKFSHAVTHACAEVETESTALWLAGFKRSIPVLSNNEVVDWREEVDWRAVQAYLERRFPDRWKPRAEQAVTGADGGPVQHEHAMHDLSKLSVDELRTLQALTAKAEGGAE